MIAALVASAKLPLQSSVCNGFLQQKVEMSGFISTVCVGVKEATISDKTSFMWEILTLLLHFIINKMKRKPSIDQVLTSFTPDTQKKPSTHTVLHEQDAFLTFTPSSCTNLSLLYMSVLTV